MQLHPLPSRELHCGRHRLSLAQPQIMGILNVTPDSFSDGGRFLHSGAALQQAEMLLMDGASIIDIGGESTRPHAVPVSPEEEMARILPVIGAIIKRFDCIVSVDTSSPMVFEAAAQLGAVIWNDVRSLTRPGALECAVRWQLPVVLMHHRGEPSTMDQLANYQDVATEVLAELAGLRERAVDGGLAPEKILLDPGFGFAKTAHQNMALLAQLWRLHELESPLLIGISRKRVLGELLGGAPVDQRVMAGAAAALMAVQQGVSIIRTHDVRATRECLKVYEAMANA